jgi:biopolymer transport protein ExbD
MSSVDLGGGGKSKKKGTGGAKKPKRIGFKLDMTPLVDVAFLLLTFFRFATTMSQPQIMEMSIPPDMTNNVEVKASDLFTIFVRGDNKVFYNTGVDPQLRPIALKGLKDLAVQKNAEKQNALITSLKVDPKAKYETLVDILDELNQAEGTLVDQYRQQKQNRERRFTIAPMEQADKDLLAAQ